MALEKREGSGPADLQEAGRPEAPGVPLSVDDEQEGAAGQGAPAEAQTPDPTMSEALLAEYDYERPKRGDIRSGVIVSMQPSEIIVDIGAKRECIVAGSDYQKLVGEAAVEFHAGDEVSVYVIKPEDRDGHLLGSLYLAQMESDWTRAEEFEASGEIFEARVSGQNRGGLLVPFGRLRGFVPASHLVGPSSRDGDQPVALTHWIGKTLPFKVIEVNRRRNRLILSYRAARRQWRPQQREGLLETLHEGDTRRGVVSSLASFGAFVDLGGADGLIHISELAWYRVEHPSDLLRVGQEIDVYVLRVDPSRGRVGLSLKRLQPDPWTLVEGKYAAGQVVQVRITKLVDFGAFAEVEKGIEGLIHASELADAAPARVEDAVQPGEVHLARVLRVDAENRRIGLSLRAVAPEEHAAQQEQAPDAAEPDEPDLLDEIDLPAEPAEPAEPDNGTI
ncbi:MAG TPA: S1 RNA-binding domain-containing protein [Anaerolineae bacterium]|nr:S1 RNA-binding domain-containing protein [Anaerolineae bacterium]